MKRSFSLSRLVTTSSLVAGAALAFAACAPQDRSEAEPEAAPAAANESPAPTQATEAPAGGGTSELVFQALGNEPFWNVRVWPDRIRFEPMGEDAVTYPQLENLSEPGTGTWIFRGSGPAGEIEVVISNRPCSDTMSDEEYEYASSVRVGERTLEGCARKGGASG